MKVTEIENSGLARKLAFVIPAKEIEQKFDTKLQEIIPQVVYPGYRRGKVPRKLVESRYGASIYSDLLQETLREVSEAELKNYELFSQPKIDIDSHEKGKDLSFTCAFEIFPKVELPEFKSLEVEKPAYSVTDKDIAKQLQEIREANPSFQEVEEPIEKDGRVFVEIGAPKSDKAKLYYNFKSGAFEPVSKDAADKEAADKIISNPAFPPLMDGLVGKSKGDSIQCKVQAENEEKINYKVKVLAVYKAVLPEENDELAQKFGHKDLAALKAHLKSLQESDCADKVYSISAMRLFNKLENLLDFEVPPSMLAAETGKLLPQMKELEGYDKLSEEELKEKAEAVAKRRARIGLMLQEYAKANDIKPENSDIEEVVMKEINQFPAQLRAAAVQWYQNNPARLQAAAAIALERKAVNAILVNEVKLVEKKVTVSDLDSILEEETNKRLEF